MTSTKSSWGVPSSGNPRNSLVASDGSLPSTSKGSNKKAKPLVQDSNSSLSLAAIINSFSGPIKEEHAWAVIYECCQCLKKLVSAPEDQNSPKLFLAATMAQIYIHKDGRIHESTFLNPYTRSGGNIKFLFSITPPILASTDLPNLTFSILLR